MPLSPADGRNHENDGTNKQALDYRRVGKKDDVATELNRVCLCTTLDRGRLEAAFVRDVGDPALLELLRVGRPHLFSDVSVFIHADSFAEMAKAVRIIETTAKLPEYKKRVMEWAPAIARTDYGPVGAFMGYDFHISSDGPKLIEINTNAGGAFLNAIMAKAQSACCGISASLPHDFSSEAFEQAVGDMFAQEWCLQRKSGLPSRVAIIDERPVDQYLYPDFVLAKRLLERRGFKAVIASPEDLTYSNGQLICRGELIDFVYNRIVDFSFAAPDHWMLKEAYEGGKVVFSPNPHVHALLADKRNLTLLSNPAELRAMGAAECDVPFLTKVIPKTLLVTEEDASELWAARRDYFFKPSRGYGSKAAYRGAKLTRRVWSEIITGSYVAQRFTPPSERMVTIDDVPEPRKIDVRLYTYDGAILLTAARLYEGQTTSFRTEGGGFAPVLQTSAMDVCPIKVTSSNTLSGPKSPEI